MTAAANAVQSGAVRAERALEAQHYRADIDGLRGIAVIAVVAFHAFPAYFPGGYVGVDVFFVVSGFLISSIILRQLQASRFTYLQFYVRRVLRIFPALIVVLVASLLIGAFALLPDELEELGKHVASAAVFVSNFTLWQESGYFNRAAELKPLLHLWSLGVEEQFYLVWPLLLALLWTRRRNVAISVLALSAASLALAIVTGRISPIANFYMPFSRFWELGLGCLLAIVAHSPKASRRLFDASQRLSDRSHSLLALVGVGLIALAMFTFDRDTPFPGLAALVPTLGAVCVIIARADAWFPQRVLASGGLLLLGLISYPLYLWHWPLLSFATILESGEPRASTRIVAILMSAGLAWLTFKFVEQPVRTRRRRRDALVLVVALAVLGGGGFFIYARQGFPDRVAVDVQSIRPEPRTNASCMDRFAEGGDFNYCKSTSSAPPETIFLGDSRAQAVYDGIAAAKPQSALTLLGRGGCPPLLSVELHYIAEEGCSEVWSTFARYVALTKPSVVVLVGGGSDLFDPAVAELESSDRWGGSRHAAFKHGLRELIVALQRTSQVIYVTQFPQFHTSPSCFLRRVRLPGTRCEPTLDRGKVEANTAAYDRIVRELQAELPQLRVVDSRTTLCDSRHCSQRLPSGAVIYSDELHLSPAGGAYFVQRSGLMEMLFEEEPGTRGD